MGLKLIVDSASDISIEEAKELGIRVMPLSISFADKDYKDGVDLSKLEFYKKLKESSELPKTSQVSPYEFDQAINDVVSNGDAAIVITIASTLSGTYSSATIAASNYPDDKVVVIDSMTASVGERVLVLYALDLIKQGLDIKEIAKILNEKKEKIRIVYLMDTLETLYKGGRLSRLETMTGSILGVKPILALTDG
ncbi:MAG: DegV family protein, partial [Peptostreptococcus sp.]|nr:DegV family protein [Peptostreptococcus sp.]